MASPTPSRDGATSVGAPAHPVPHLQGPFEESMLESANEITDQETDLDAGERRALLLESPHYERLCAGRWKQKPGEKYHPLWKIAAQISFGMHLLAEGMAKSEEEVMIILQSHVDDVDSFLERTTEDFDLALGDIQERLRYLKLPLEHLDVFDRMLEDRAFRASIVDGNEKIEHIVDRTTTAIKDALKDVQKGLDSTRALGRYLDDLENLWVRKTPEHEAVFVAMLGNVEGWGRAFMDLHLQGNRLKVILIELSETVSEMMRRVGDISRQSVRHAQPNIYNAQQQSNGRPKPKVKGRSKGKHMDEYRSSASHHKALPTAPDLRESAILAERNRRSRNVHHSGSNHASHKFLTSKTSPLSSSGLIPTNSPNKTDFYARPFSPGSRTGTTSSRNSPEPSMRGAKAGPKAISATFKRSHPIELPAEVPRSALLQAPLSKENRKSMNLEPSPTEDGNKRISKKLSNKVLETLLKTPLSSRMSHTPHSVISGRTTDSYIKVDESPAGHKAEYFSASDVRDSVLFEESEFLDSNSHESSTRGLGIKSNDPQNKDQLRTVVSPSRSIRLQHNSAFTSHPPDTGMLQSPDGKQSPFSPRKDSMAKTESTSAHSRDQSLAMSLGEPGPEIDEFEPFDLATMKKPYGEPPLTPTIAIEPPAGESLEESQLQHADTEPEKTPTISTEKITIPSKSTTEPPFITELEGSALIVAELAGTTPDIEPTGPPSSAPIEMEGDAPSHHYFSLPPRSSSVVVSVPQAKPDEGAMASATIASQADFFKMPPPIVAKHESSEKMDSQSPHPTKAVSQLMTKNVQTVLPPGGKRSLSAVAREERGSVVAPRRIPRKPMSRMAQVQSVDLFDSISSTPPGSPIHARTSSELSSHSAMRRSVEGAGGRIRAISATANQEGAAPVPPAPGGRAMVSPDYAAQGAFEGERVDPRKEERKRGKRADVISVGGWKRLFAGRSPLKEGVPGTEKGKGKEKEKEGGEAKGFFEGVVVANGERNGNANTNADEQAEPVAGEAVKANGYEKNGEGDGENGEEEVKEKDEGKGKEPERLEEEEGEEEKLGDTTLGPMMTSAGKDVLWFKGMTREGVWLSAESG